MEVWASSCLELLAPEAKFKHSQLLLFENHLRSTI